MQVSLKEVQDFWAAYCQRHQVSAEDLAEGLRRIAANHEYWSDHTMQELHAAVKKRSKSN